MAQLCATLLLITSVERLVLGGGILNRACLYDKVRQQLVPILNGYIQTEMLEDANIASLICSSQW